MSSLLSSSEVTFFTGEFAKHFDTFAVSTVLIYKCPTISYTDPNSNNYFPGYGDQSNPTNISNTLVYESFPCIAKYGRDQKIEIFKEVNIGIPQGQCQIKVMEPARNYIDNGVKTENIILDGITWNEITSDGCQNYLGLRYFYYLLKRVN